MEIRVKRLRNTRATLTMAVGKKRHAKGWEIDPSSDEEVDRARHVRPANITRHVDYVSQPSGVSLRTTYHNAPPPQPLEAVVESPVTLLIPCQTDGDETVFLEEDMESAFPWALGTEDSEVATRKRTAGVSIAQLLALIEIDHLLQDRPLLQWVPEIDSFLLELLRLEGRCDTNDDAKCSSCFSSAAKYRCCDCQDLRLYCAECTVEKHRFNPLHRVKVSVSVALV